MKRNVAKELEKLIKSFNEKNETNEGLKNHLSYVCKVNRFMRGGYDVMVEYKCFFSTDFEKLMQFINANKLNMFLGAYSGEYERSGFLSIQ